MIDRKELKARAKDFAFNNKWMIWKPILIVSVVMCLASFIPSLFGKNTFASILSLALSLAIVPLSIGLVHYVMKKVHGEEADLMECLKSKYKFFIPILILTIVACVLVGLGFALFVIPGIILVLRYAMISYIAAEEEENLDGIEVLKKSAKMMDGHKWEYFVLQLSFIGWMLLGSITLGIAYIWVMPYMTVTQIYYYDELKKLEK